MSSIKRLSKTIGEPLINPSVKVGNQESFTTGNPRTETNRIIFAEGLVPSVGMELVDGLFTRHTDMPILVTSINPDGDNAYEVEVNLIEKYDPLSKTFPPTSNIENISF